MAGFGNSHGVRNTGLREPTEESALSKLNIASTTATNPDLAMYERGEFLAEVVEYHMNLDQSTDIPFRLSCRPLDTHLGLPEDISQLPTFYPIPSLYNNSVPAPGTIVRVRFDDLNNKHVGTYHGPESGVDTPVNCGNILTSARANGTTNKQRTNAKSAFKKNDPVDPKNAKYCSRNSDGDIKTSYRGCGASLEENKGSRTLNIAGVGMVEKNFIIYIDGNGKRYLAPDYMKKALDAMSQAMKADIGLTLSINDIYRPAEQQQCYRDRYLACVKEWEDSGKKGRKPAIAGSVPKEFKPWSHLAGNAIDISTGVPRKNIDHLVALVRQGKKQEALDLVQEEAKQGKYSKTWNWILLNSKNYGFYWGGLTAHEPWHFIFDENLARSKGFI